MATLQELQNLHEELIECCGSFMATVKAINGEEDASMCAEMCVHAEVAKKAMLAVCAKISELMELKREAE